MPTFFSSPSPLSEGLLWRRRVGMRQFLVSNKTDIYLCFCLLKAFCPCFVQVVISNIAAACFILPYLAPGIRHTTGEFSFRFVHPIISFRDKGCKHTVYII